MAPATDNTLDRIRDAYADAARDQPAEYLPLPAWFVLRLEMREAIIHVFFRGGNVAMDTAEIKKERWPA
jgi:hypothetical protein